MCTNRLHDTCNFIDASKINDYVNVIYSIAPSQDFYPLGLFKDNQSKELNFPTLFYGHPQDLTISKNLSYQQITQWEFNCFTNVKIFELIFLTFFFKLLKFLSKK